MGWQDWAGTALNVAAPVVGNMIAPGAGGIVGGAVGSILADFVQGDIHDFGDFAMSGIVGAGSAAIGGKFAEGLGARLGVGVGPTFKPANVPFGMSGTFFAGMGANARALTAVGTRSGLRYPGQTLGQAAGVWLGHRFVEQVNWMGQNPRNPESVSDLHTPSVVYCSDINDTEFPGQVLIPDNDKNPGRTYDLSRAVVSFCDELPRLFFNDWDSFGSGEVESVPESGPVLQVSGADRSNIPQYQTRADELAAAFRSLQDADTKLVPIVHAAGETRNRGQYEIVSLATDLNDRTGLVPPQGTTEDDYITATVFDVVDSAAQSLAQVADEMQGQADQADALKALDEKLTKEIQDSIRRIEDALAPPPGGELQTAPANDSFPYGLGSQYDPWPVGTDTADPAVTTRPEPYRDPSNATTPYSAAPAAGTGGAPIDSGIGSMLPMLAMQDAMRRADEDQRLRDDELRDQLDERGRDVDRDSAVPPVAPATPAPGPQTPPAAQTPWSKPGAGAIPTSHPPAGPPPGTPTHKSWTQSGTGDSVVYTFPDGRTQCVWRIVAAALDAAFANVAGTDAKSAYAATAAKWSDDSHPGDQVDPYQLISGDLARWEQRTALVVTFGPAEGAVLEVVVDGRLQQFGAEMTDSKGEFGQFAGFFHPAAIPTAAPGPHSDSGAAPNTPAAGPAVRTPAPSLPVPA
ncbi:MAG: hypothetical protein HOQ24_03885 [Mycobacteriaceae bacterium]|nr:hypothetical protein [Mycobacteriaceae bacterium]